MNEINEMSVADVVASAAFKTNLQKLIDNVCESRLHLANEARKRDRQLKRHPIDRMIERDFFTAEQLAPEYLKVLEKTSKLSASERMNVLSICNEAFKTTVKELAKGNPDAEKRLKK